MHIEERTGTTRVPPALVIGFALFVAALAYMVATSLARRDAPVYQPSSPSRERSSQWMLTGDTITLDATDGDRWQRVSLASGRPVTDGDTTPWEIAVRRYRITAAGALADLGAVPFESAAIRSSTRFVASAPGEMENEAIHRWYRYSLVTHLLTPNGHVYALRTPSGESWKLQPIAYYCPHLTPGCLTIRYAPLSTRGAR